MPVCRGPHNQFQRRSAIWATTFSDVQRIVTIGLLGVCAPCNRLCICLRLHTAPRLWIFAVRTRSIQLVSANFIKVQRYSAIFDGTDIIGIGFVLQFIWTTKAIYRISLNVAGLWWKSLKPVETRHIRDWSSCHTTEVYTLCACCMVGSNLVLDRILIGWRWVWMFECAPESVWLRICDYATAHTHMCVCV